MPPRTAAANPRNRKNALAQLVEQGPYFTDHVRLFRLVGSVRGSSGPRLVQLEDCRTLDVSDYTEDEVAVLGLEPVTPAAQAAEGSAAARDREDRGGTRAHQP